MSSKNSLVTCGRFEIIEYKISSSPGEVGEESNIAWSNSSTENGRLCASEFRLGGGTTVVEFLMFLKAGE